MTYDVKDQEEWVYIPFFPGYQVSNMGNVRSLDRYTTAGQLVAGKVLKPGQETKGYYMVRLSFGNKSKGFKVHRLVAMMFLPNPNNYPEVNHIDGNKHNNTVFNLEWVTSKQNRLHATRVLKVRCGLTGKFGKDHPRSKQIHQIKDGKIVGVYFGTREAERLTGINRVGINSALNGRAKTAGGYIWKYKDKQ